MNLNTPGTYVHWSVVQISLANLVLICAMLVIFAAALLLPFPKGHRSSDGPVAAVAAPPAPTPLDGEAEDEATGPDADMWTARLRRRLKKALPYDKLLPDRQPAYVASWVYVFGVASLAALGIVILSGCLLAIAGPDWWHTTVVGHYFNSLHLWSVEMFMAFMVIHLWGKFWMAAWRGKRTATWMSGVIAFLASVVECFTGYVSQQNFDSQWISTSGKDAFNAAGIGAFFNVMNFGQMLMWHIVLLPLVLFSLVGAHILLVRVRGVSHPLPQRRERGRVALRAARARDAASWRGPTRRYDILKEGTIATLVVAALVALLAGVLSSPDEPSVTIQSWATVAPADFVATAATELNYSSFTATYGPPYNHSMVNVATEGPHWQLIAGVRQPVDSAKDFVLKPLSKLAATDATLASALSTYEAATSAQQTAWATAYVNAVTGVKNLPFRDGAPVVPKANDGPVPTLVAREYRLARSGALDADLLAGRTFYGTNFTKPLLFLEDGQYFSNLAAAQHLTGEQWGVMNETGSYPGQPWLWLYTLWYQVPGFRDTSNADLTAIYMTGLGTLLLLAVPFIPGLRDVPRLVPIHRLIWRKWGTKDGADRDA